MEFFVFVVNIDLNKEFNKKCQIAERKEHNVNEDSYTSGDMFVYILSLFDLGTLFQTIIKIFTGCTTLCSVLDEKNAYHNLGLKTWFYNIYI